MKKLTGAESFVYYLLNILTLGSLWIVKIACKKAITEVLEEK